MCRKVEEWRDIPGYDGLYQASDWGRIRSLHGAGSPTLMRIIISQTSAGTKCARITLRKPGGKAQSESVPRLIALTWLGGVPVGTRAFHRDKNVENNSRWNIVFKNPVQVMNSGVRTKRRAVLKIDKSLTVVGCYGSIRKAAAASAIGHATIGEYCRHVRTRTVFAPDGYIYAFDDERHLRKTLDRAKAELDALGIRYNDPGTERYYDLTPEETPELDGSVPWEDAPAPDGGG